MNMIEGVNSVGGTQLTIYIGWRGGEAAQGAPQVGGILLRVLPIWPPPFPIPIRSRKGRGGRGNPIPFFVSFFPFPSPIRPAHMGGAPAP